MHQLFRLLILKSSEICLIINSQFYSKNFTWILSGHLRIKSIKSIKSRS